MHGYNNKNFKYSLFAWIAGRQLLHRFSVLIVFVLNKSISLYRYSFFSILSSVLHCLFYCSFFQQMAFLTSNRSDVVNATSRRKNKTKKNMKIYTTCKKNKKHLSEQVSTIAQMTLF